MNIDVDMLFGFIAQYGYAALFFALWLGIVGMPIPDEVIVMTGGAATSTGLLHLVPAFLLTYLGVISGLSLGYVLGRFAGTPVIDRLRRKKNMDKYFTQTEQLIGKYGSFSLVISYFIPVVRHVLPYIVGVSKMSFTRYALTSYPVGFVWTLCFFVIGRFAGNHVAQIGELVHAYGIKLVWVPILAAVIFLIIRKIMIERKRIRVKS